MARVTGPGSLTDGNRTRSTIVEDVSADAEAVGSSIGVVGVTEIEVSLMQEGRNFQCRNHGVPSET